MQFMKQENQLSNEEWIWDMIVMSIEAYEKEQYDQEVYLKLKEAEIEAKVTSERYVHNDVMNTMRSFINQVASDEV